MVKKKVDVISLNNKPVNEDVKKEPISVDKRFLKTNTKIEKPKGILMKNGRPYKMIDRHMAMFSDTGEVFYANNK